VLLAFLSIYVFWGSSFVVIRIGVQNLPPLLFGGVRFVIAGVIMLLIARLYGNRVQPQRHEWRHLAVLACFGFLLSNGLSVWAMQYVSSNQAALLNASVPCWIVMLGAFGSRAHQPAPRALTGVVLGVIGTILVCLYLLLAFAHVAVMRWLDHLGWPNYMLDYEVAMLAALQDGVAMVWWSPAWWLLIPLVMLWLLPKAARAN